jgi:predicted GH43/DUF377 family glycosyl hydrolase
MHWHKLGLIYKPTGEMPWAYSHAFVPTPILIDRETIRIFISFWDKKQIGRIGFVDLQSNNPIKIKKISAQPVLDIGEAGHFDDHGVTPTSVVREGTNILLFYSGWQLGVKERYYIFTGVAVSANKGETFERLSPVLTASSEEPFARSGAHILKEGNLWRLWYNAGCDWADINGKARVSCDIRYLESSDFLQWQPVGNVCFKPNRNDEFSLSMPHVWRTKNWHHMIYSIRSADKGYRLGYAESEDGQKWYRKDDQVGINVSPSGWDSEMICFGTVTVTPYGTYLFYGGNNLGEAGFGVAVLEE